GALRMVVRQGDRAPAGGTIAFMQSWPSLVNSRGTLGASTPGASDGASTSHMLFGIGAGTVTRVTALPGAGPEEIGFRWDAAETLGNGSAAYDVVRGGL